MARKAKPLSRNSGVDQDGSIWVEGEHDGFNKYGASHKRSIKFFKSKNGEICFYLKDEVFVEKLMAWRVWFHLGPNQNKNLINPIILELKKFHKFEFQWKETWYSSKFGQRITRKSLCIHGQINKGYHEFSFKLPLMK